MPHTPQIKTEPKFETLPVVQPFKRKLKRTQGQYGNKKLSEDEHHPSEQKVGLCSVSFVF